MKNTLRDLNSPSGQILVLFAVLVLGLVAYRIVAMTDGQFTLYIIVSALVALGTIGTVVAALYGNILRAKFRPPVLRVKLLTTVGEKTKFTNPQTGAYIDACRYYHLQVSNENRRWSTATNLDVRLVRIEEPGPDSQLQITWAGDIPIRCRHQEFYPLKQEIGSPIDYDLCSVRKAGAFELHPIIVPNNLQWQRNGPCHLVLFFQVKSTQIDSNIVRFQIDWDGNWDDGDTEMQNHFKIKMLPTTPTNSG